LYTIHINVRRYYQRRDHAISREIRQRHIVPVSGTIKCGNSGSTERHKSRTTKKNAAGSARSAIRPYDKIPYTVSPTSTGIVADQHAHNLGENTLTYINKHIRINFKSLYIITYTYIYIYVKFYGIQKVL